MLQDSGSEVVVCEDEAQVAKIRDVRTLRHVVVIDELDELRERGSGLAPEPLLARAEAVRPEDPLTFMYTSGTTGPPKGCVLSHGNYRSVLDMLVTTDRLRAGETVYLFLPLAHAFAKLTQLGCFDLGGTIAYFGGDIRQVMAEVQEVQPEILPAVPRVFEKLYTLAVGSQPPEVQEQLHAAAALGARVRDGEALGPEELALFERADAEVLSRVLKGPNIFQGYHGNAEPSFGAVVDGWLHTGDLARIDDDGYVWITGRKKDIVITAGGKKLTPANLENELKRSRWISHAVLHGDRRPCAVMLVTLDEEEIVPWSRAQRIEDVSVAALSRHPAVRELVQAELDRANEKVGRVEQAKRFFILERDLSQEAGELTPTLKIKRNVVNERFADRFDALYEAY